MLDTLLIRLEINHELAVYPRKKLFTKENRDSSILRDIVYIIVLYYRLYFVIVDSLWRKERN